MDNKDNKINKEQSLNTKCVRLTLHSADCKAIEELCSIFLSSAKNRHMRTQGPKRMPVKRLNITTRKTPCGQGTNTWDKLEMRLYKRVIDIHVPENQLNEISTFATVSKNITVEVSILDENRKRK